MSSRSSTDLSGQPTPSAKVPLRIMPLGDSITWGYLSTDGNGYRQTLLNHLTSTGSTVKYIGSQRSGNMSDNYNEGHPGAIIFQIALYAQPTFVQQPNLILVMAGTNDMAARIEPDTAPDRLGSLIDLCTSACPDAVVIVAELIPNSNATTEAMIQKFNSLIPGMVEERVAKGMKVLSVDMGDYLTVSDLVDGLHPNDQGYGFMADAWRDGIAVAEGKGWITPPVAVNGIAS